VSRSGEQEILTGYSSGKSLDLKSNYKHLHHRWSDDAILLCDFLLTKALAQAREDAPPPQNHAVRADPPPLRRGNRLLIHACLAFEPRFAAR
jgi:hypothetical protein